MTDPATTRVTAPAPRPAAPTPPRRPSDDVLFDPEDDLEPPPKPAEQPTGRPSVITLVDVEG